MEGMARAFEPERFEIRPKECMAASMARRTTRTTARRNTPAKRRPRPRTTRRKAFALRWYHLLASIIGAFALGYLVAFMHATTYVSQVAGVR
jgi:hypothetical protein